MCYSSRLDSQVKSTLTRSIRSKYFLQRGLPTSPCCNAARLPLCVETNAADLLRYFVQPCRCCTLRWPADAPDWLLKYLPNSAEVEATLELGRSEFPEYLSPHSYAPSPSWQHGFQVGTQLETWRECHATLYKTRMELSIPVATLVAWS